MGMYVGLDVSLTRTSVCVIDDPEPVNEFATHRQGI